ncbi:hypothetical protein [Streptomyces sp. A1-5]|uniref:hypothetical protein n=1 Tax=Streptomyces sp. A1-5 TaxID=2738410 RepID=UPI001F2CD9CD|nr:hypothetical protein [Streptomyces sp. A1-5]UJB43444.1 hypothetical protein HRD51_23910 [Streptomyces sp. A1-5]
MSSATISPVSVHAVPRRSADGATALGTDAATGSAAARAHRRPVGSALRAVKVFAAAAFSVVVMGEYTEG